MQSPLRSIGIPHVVLMVSLSFLLFLPTDIIAQDQLSGGGDQLNDFQKKKLEIQEAEQASSTLGRKRSGINTNSLDGDYLIFEHDQMWNRNPNPNPEWDFPLYEQGVPAGNINGDSLNGNPRNDFVVTGKTGTLNASTWKTAIFFGGNTSGKPDQIIPRELVPVGDLNGDGRGDAVAVDNLGTKSVEIYKGTDFGYESTGFTLDNLDPDNFNILGFKDFNGDNRDDIFAYSETTGDVKLALGQISFSDMLVDTYNDRLSSSPKKVFAKDIDGNNSVEIVEFYGINGDGQIQVFEFLDLAFLQKIYPFGFNPSFDKASDAKLHLIDINGNSYDDIFISLGEGSTKYVAEYDTVGDSYESPTEIFDGEMFPVGDLDNDKHQDFIMEDPTNSDLYIAYGSNDFSNSTFSELSKVELVGNNSTNWSWEMEYNPYSGFGDLDGDGIDDALLFHAEYSENIVYYGRRFIPGSEELTSDNSEFQLYPSEYFYNRIYEIEELGDINTDGVDDFAMVLQDQGKVEVYFGGNNISESPDQSFSSGYYIEGITRGDYTGDGISDIVVLSKKLGGLQIEVFEGGSSFSKIKSINISDFQDAEYNDALGVNDIGDINGNGSSDFIIGSGSAGDTTGGDVYLHQGYIFHGGTSISSTPDEIRNLDPSNDFSSDKINAASSAAALGDLDGDGLGDFAVGSPRKGEYGEVAVYLSDSNDPIRFSSSAGFYFGSDIVSGDFNRDGIKDLAVSVPFAETVAEVYYGSEDFDTAPDQSLPLPDFFTEESESNIMTPSLEVIPDFNNDGKDELIIGSSGLYKNHAAIYTDIDSDPKASLIEGANDNAALGGTTFINTYATMATGDFTSNGALDVVISQYNDNQDAYQSSRVYRYELSDQMPPGQVQGLEIVQQDTSKVLSWQQSEADDLDAYLIYSLEDGELSDKPLTIVNETEYILADDFEGVQDFVVSARDIYGLIGDPSSQVTAIYPKTVTYDINAGWNLLTLAVEDDSANSALQDLTTGPIYEYIGGYQEVEQVEEGGAYWIKFADAANPEFHGLPLTELSLELNEGWNLIGSIGGELPVSFIDDPDEIIVPETIYSFDNAYVKTDTLGPTKGYWIRTSSAGTVTLTHPKFSEQQSEGVDKSKQSLSKSAGEITELFNKITISDDEHSAELYFGSKLPNGADKRMFSLPPLPPGDVFDARFEDDMRLTENGKVDIRLNTIAGKSLKMKIEAGPTAEANQFVIKEFADDELLAKHTVTDSEEITLRHKQADSIALTPVGISELGQKEAPGEFGLEQNYPNPFNPTTQIQYSVAEAANVKIDVFNIIGRRIVTLVNERQEPGTYEVTFDGSNFASGIYLYRLQAGDYISTKKFILAK